MLSLLAALIGALLLAVTAAAEQAVDGSNASPVTAGAVVVSMSGNRFRPAMVTVPAGTAVRWTNDEGEGGEEHNVIARDYRWASDTFPPGEAYEHTFDAPGEYRYFCDLHGGMTGRVTVTSR